MPDETPHVDPDEPAPSRVPMSKGALDLIQAADLRSIRLGEVHASADDQLPAELELRLSTDQPAYRRDTDLLIVRFTNTIVCGPPKFDDDAALARISVTHVVEFQLAGNDSLNEMDATTFIDSTVRFMVWPYVRASVQALGTDLGLPTFVLPVIRRPAFVVEPELTERAD